MSASGTEIVLLDVAYDELGVRLQDVRFDSASTVFMVKDKLKMKVGLEPDQQKLVLEKTGHWGAVGGSVGGSGAIPTVDMSDESATLASLGAMNNMRIVVTSVGEGAAAFDPNAVIPKYEISDRAYGERGNTFRAHRAKESIEVAVQQFPLGTRVRIAKTGALATVRFVGAADALGTGAWLGVELDDGGGKHDGEVKGVRLFTCGAGKGCVLRPGGACTLDDEATAGAAAAAAGAGASIFAAAPGASGSGSSSADATQQDKARGQDDEAEVEDDEESSEDEI